MKIIEMLKNLQNNNIMFVYGTYVLKGEADSNFSLCYIWNLFQEPNNAINYR